MAINLGTDFEQELITLAGWEPNTVDSGSTSIDFINTAGQTTVRATTVANVDTGALQALIVKYATPSTTEPEAAS